MQDNAFTVFLRFGPLRVQAYPPKEKKPPRKKKERKPKERPEPEEPRPRRNFLTLRNLRFALETLPPIVRRLLTRIFRGVRIAPCRVAVVIGGERDPASAAVQCGTALGGVWAVMPVVERFLRIPDPRISVSVDFQSEKTRLTGEIGVSARLGTLTGASLGALIPLVRAFFRWRREDAPPKARRKRSRKVTA